MGRIDDDIEFIMAPPKDHNLRFIGGDDTPFAIQMIFLAFDDDEDDDMEGDIEGLGSLNWFSKWEVGTAFCGVRSSGTFGCVNNQMIS